MTANTPIQVCPACQKEYTGFPALSRTDNVTSICSACGELQALAEWKKPRTMTTTPDTTPDRFPRYCSECGEGMRTGYQHEEDTSLCYCSLDCAADGLEMTTDELEEAYDNAVNGREAKRPSSETLVTYEDWTDSPHEDYETGDTTMLATRPTYEAVVRLDALQNMANIGCQITIHQTAYDDKRKKRPMFFACIGKKRMSPILDYTNLNHFLLGFRRALEITALEYSLDAVNWRELAKQMIDDYADTAR